MRGPLVISRLDGAAPDFWPRLESLLSWDDGADERVQETVARIIADVRARGDAALLEYTERLDDWKPAGAAALALDAELLGRAFDSISGGARSALERAAARIRMFHERQVQRSWSYTERDGTVLGQQVSPIERVGLYVPGGKAAYPSSVLMSSIPARVAGVQELVMVVPSPGRRLNDLVLAAAHLAGIHRVFLIGGAQAVAALAYGTETVPRVDKIVGPGNVYVATAKRMVFGTVGIDMVAGPSEILIVCDGSTPPGWVAADLFSQAEHDEEARAILICPDPAYIDEVHREMERLLPTMGRADIIRASLAGHGAMIEVRDLDDAIEVVNAIAPEHLELSVAQPEALVGRVKHAGAIFLGRYTSEVLGDYCAGPNHVLPTARTARFSSALGVQDFQKKTSVLQCSKIGADTLGEVAAELARGEGLTAHAHSAELRRNPEAAAGAETKS